jgi:hypothetical protein
MKRKIIYEQSHQFYTEMNCNGILKKKKKHGELKNGKKKPGCGATPSNSFVHVSGVLYE